MSDLLTNCATNCANKLCCTSLYCLRAFLLLPIQYHSAQHLDIHYVDIYFNNEFMFSLFINILSYKLR